MIRKHLMNFTSISKFLSNKKTSFCLLLLMNRGRFEPLNGYGDFLNPIATFCLNSAPPTRIRNRPRNVHQTDLVGLVEIEQN